MDDRLYLLALGDGLASPLGPTMISVWLFLLGTVFGSFANVVVYRLPRGMSLSHPPSRCPACEQPIRWHDNVPVLGWLRLGGRCRDCRAPISIRYPLVEVVFGLLFLSLGYWEVLGAGTNLPLRLLAIGSDQPPDWALYAYHLVLVATLLVAALIELDGQSVPWSLVIFGLLGGLLPPLVWPALRPVAAVIALPGEFIAQGWFLGLAEGLAGLTAGALLGALSWPASASGPGCTRRRWIALSCLALVGAALGWQATCGVAVVAAALQLPVTLLMPRGSTLVARGWLLGLTTATWFWLANWSAIELIDTRWTGTFDIRLLLAAGAMVAAASGLIFAAGHLGSRATPRRETTKP